MSISELPESRCGSFKEERYYNWMWARRRENLVGNCEELEREVNSASKLMFQGGENKRCG